MENWIEGYFALLVENVQTARNPKEAKEKKYPKKFTLGNKKITQKSKHEKLLGSSGNNIYLHSYNTACTQ